MHVTFPNGKKRVELTATELSKFWQVKSLLQALCGVGITAAGEAAEKIGETLAAISEQTESATVPAKK